MGAGSRERYPPAHRKVPLPAPCSLPRTASPGANRDPDLHPEHVLPRLALQPQQARVEVPDHRATREIAPQPAVQCLSDAAVRALGVEAGEQEADLAVDPSPTRPHPGLVARREQDGGGPAARVGATADDLQGGEIDLEPDAARWLLGVAPEADAHEGAAGPERPGHGDEIARRGAERAGGELTRARTAERDRDVGARLERLDLALRHLEKPALDDRRRVLARVDTDAQPEAERDLARRRDGVRAGKEQAQRRRLGDAREPELRGGEGRDAARADGVVVGVERVQGEPAHAAVGAQVAVASDREPALAVITSDQGDGATVSREAVARPRQVLERD